MERSEYRNPLTRLEPNQPSKTFRVFTSAASAASWLRVRSNADKVVKDAAGKMQVHKWADGRVGVTYYGSVRHPYRLKLAPERRITPELWALENRRAAS